LQLKVKLDTSFFISFGIISILDEMKSTRVDTMLLYLLKMTRCVSKFKLDESMRPNEGVVSPLFGAAQKAKYAQFNTIAPLRLFMMGKIRKNRLDHAVQLLNSIMSTHS
jgi:hypothetical protein